MSDLGLREQVMVNQFVVAAGCAQDQARQFLQSTHWQFETALSMFLQEPTSHILGTSPTTMATAAAIAAHPNGRHQMYSHHHQSNSPTSTIGSTNFIGYNDDLRHSRHNHNSSRNHYHQNTNHHQNRTLLSASTNHHRLHSILTPANTPATPPNFPETLLSFAKLRASDENDADDMIDVDHHHSSFGHHPHSHHHHHHLDNDHDGILNADHSDVSSGNFSNSDI